MNFAEDYLELVPWIEGTLKMCFLSRLDNRVLQSMPTEYSSFSIPQYMDNTVCVVAEQFLSNRGGVSGGCLLYPICDHSCPSQCQLPCMSPKLELALEELLIDLFARDPVPTLQFNGASGPKQFPDLSSSAGSAQPVSLVSPLSP